MNCISHSCKDSSCILLRSDKSSYSSFTALVSALNVANPRLASCPPNASYGPPSNKKIKQILNRVQEFEDCSFRLGLRAITCSLTGLKCHCTHFFSCIYIHKPNVYLQVGLHTICFVSLLKDIFYMTTWHPQNSGNIDLYH